MQKHFTPPQQQNPSIMVKQEVQNQVLQHPIAIATKIVNRFLHIYICLNDDQQIKSDKDEQQIFSSVGQFEKNLQKKSIYYSYLEEEVLMRDQTLIDWFGTLEKFQEYVEDVSNVLVDVKGMNARVMVSPFEGKIKRVEIWRCSIFSKQKVQKTEYSCDLSMIDGKKEISNQDLTTILRILAHKLINFCEKHPISSEDDSMQDARHNGQKQTLTLALADKMNRLQQQFEEFGKEYNSLIRGMQEKMSYQAKINQDKYKQLQLKVKLMTRISNGEYKQKMPSHIKEDKCQNKSSSKQHFRHQFLEANMSNSQILKEDPGYFRTRVRYRIKQERQLKDQVENIPSFIDLCSGYLFCFSFSGSEITLRKRPLEVETRQIMVLTNLAIKHGEVSTYKIRIPRSLGGSVGFGIVDSKNRNKKFCKSGDNSVKISSKGLLSDGLISSREHSFKFISDDTVIMNVYSETGIVEWIVVSKQCREMSASCTNLKIKDPNITWVPFVEMKCIGDTVEWIL